MPAAPLDARAERTRRALLAAFFDLVQGARYDDITVADLATRAGVSRSAFYAHYAGKDALLAASIAHPFAILADTLKSTNGTALIGLLDHFWENRALARSIFQDPIRRRVVAVLTDRIETILDEGGPWKRGPLILPTRLAATQLAELLLGPVIAWLAGTTPCNSTTLATALHRVAIAAMQAMVPPAPSGR